MPETMASARAPIARILVCWLCPATVLAADPRLADVRKIWDAAPHNAFTDLIHHQNRWLCVFREGEGHVSFDGALRVIESADGTSWRSAALIRIPGADLRDAKISVMPGGRLMLAGAARWPDPGKRPLLSFAWYSRDGRDWSGAQPIGDPGFWLWRITWLDRAAYTIGYDVNPDRNQRSIRLYRSANGKRFDMVVPRLFSKDSPGENTIRFRKDGTAVCLLRRDPYKGDPPIPEERATALVGTARPPYLNWRWTNLGVRVGGPNFIELPDGRLLAAVRLHEGSTRTSLCWLDPEAGTLTEFLKLPSAGDSSYAGLVVKDGTVRISYYSAHEGKTSIYFAHLRVE